MLWAMDPKLVFNRSHSRAVRDKECTRSPYDKEPSEPTIPLLAEPLRPFGIGLLLLLLLPMRLLQLLHKRLPRWGYWWWRWWLHQLQQQLLRIRQRAQLQRQTSRAHWRQTTA